MNLRTFVGEAIHDFSTVAAISPSSRFLASAMMEPLQLPRARIAVEFGAGTGAITRALLDQLHPSGTLLVFEINRSFMDCLRRNISDPRMVLINASVENLDTELQRRGVERVDAVASSLGLAFMPDRVRHALFQHLAPFLHDRSIFTQYQYIHCLQFVEGRVQRLDLRPLLNRYFGSVQSRIVWRNLPPAFVFTCSGQRYVRNAEPSNNLKS